MLEGEGVGEKDVRVEWVLKRRVLEGEGVTSPLKHPLERRVLERRVLEEEGVGEKGVRGGG